MLARTPWEKVLPSLLGPWAIVKWVLIEVQQAGMAAVASDADILSGPLPPGEAWALACQPAWLNDILLLALQRYDPHRRRGKEAAAFSGLASLRFSQMTSPVWGLAPKIQPRGPCNEGLSCILDVSVCGLLSQDFPFKGMDMVAPLLPSLRRTSQHTGSQVGRPARAWLPGQGAGLCKGSPSQPSPLRVPTNLLHQLNFLSQERELGGWERKASGGQLRVWTCLLGT